ncbi:MAG: tetratricopeptide repeat protein, partial [Burkholderiaceae bacterium]
MSLSHFILPFALAVSSVLIAMPGVSHGADFGAAAPTSPKVSKPAKLPPPTEDPDLKRAYAAYQRDDPATAYASYLRAAKRGQAIGQYNVAIMAFNGEGTKRDTAASLQWLTRAAKQGFALAQYNLGLLYENGTGIERSQKDASAWFLRAAEQDNVDAQVAVATQYLLGRGVEKSDTRAAQW